jgi:ribosome recycling factor
MSSKQVLKDAEERMEKAVGVFLNELKGLRTGRATPGLVENLRIDAYGGGSETPLKQLAQISVPEPQQIVIKPFDAAVLKDIEKAIRSSDLGLAPSNDGKLIRLQVPPMSGDQRSKLAVRVKKAAEDAKVSCRNVRRDGNKVLETAQKAGTLTEDELAKAKDACQVMLKKFEDRVGELADKKTREIQEG